MIYYYVNVPTITREPGGCYSGIMAQQTSALSQSFSGLAEFKKIVRIIEVSND